MTCTCCKERLIIRSEFLRCFSLKYNLIVCIFGDRLLLCCVSETPWWPSRCMSDSSGFRNEDANNKHNWCIDLCCSSGGLARMLERFFSMRQVLGWMPGFCSRPLSSPQDQIELFACRKSSQQLHTEFIGCRHEVNLHCSETSERRRWLQWQRLNLVSRTIWTIKGIYDFTFENMEMERTLSSSKVQHVKGN